MKMPGFVGLCYHYVRSASGRNAYPRILGNSEEQFSSHLEMLKARYRILVPDEVVAMADGKWPGDSDRPGVIITFDDGLSDHLLAADILASAGLKAFFFIPTCILADRLPANPTIVHYAVALCGLEKFVRAYGNALDAVGLDRAKNDIAFTRGKDDPWAKIAEIKSKIRYTLPYREGRRLLLHIYENLLRRERPQILEDMHLTVEQTKRILELGHSVGVHSHTHVSVAAASMETHEFEREVLAPRTFLEEALSARVSAFSYPFGGKVDCLSSEMLIKKTNQYKVAFTVEEILNGPQTPALEYGRYMPTSNDDTAALQRKIDAIIQGASA